ncbi:putative AAA domain-containing protein [Chlorella vulgaris]
MFHQSCAFCAQPAAAAVNLGPLLGPIRNSQNAASDELYAHRLCALWSSEVFETDRGTLRNVLAAIKRGRLMNFHVDCARAAGCAYYCDSFQIACPAHARMFEKEERQQPRPNPFTPARQPQFGDQPGLTPCGGGGSKDGGHRFVSPPTALPPSGGRKRGRRHEAARQHIQEARVAMKRARREMELERRRVAEHSSDDDEHFQKNEAARLARDTAKLNPITLKGDGSAVQHLHIKSPTATRAVQKGGGKDLGQLESGQHPSRHQQKLKRQPPVVETVAVSSIAATDFSNVAGLDDVVRQLREMVLLPMQYPELFQRMGLHPPRGILFHGEPGTGKTLAARALAGACAKHSPLPVTFFARKGADCLGKFHGEAERTLRLLFEEASRRAPAIIFLDELDALVPARSSRSGGGDQIYASVVSTLLSLMDGVTDRGSVIVIGATNRPEAIDPALRRPGRFDREVYFGLPTPEQRLAILQVQTQLWAQPPPAELLQRVAAWAEGFAGADLQALCTAAVMSAVRRSMPQLLEQAEHEAAGTAVGAVALSAAVPPAPAQPQGTTATAVTADAAMQPGSCQQQLPVQDRVQLDVQELDAQQRRQQLLDQVQIGASDWQEALASAPPPCSRRAGMAALAAEAAAPLQQHTLPLLARPLSQLLAALDAADVPLPAPAAAACVAAVQQGSTDELPCAAAQGGPVVALQLEDCQHEQDAVLARVLALHGALLAPAGPAVPAVPPPPASSPLPAAASAAGEGDEERQLEQLGRSYAPCRLLLCGEGEQGQEAVAGALLKLLDGCPVHCISLPSLVAEGGDDLSGACVALVSESLRRANPRTPCVFYLPRLEAWALCKAQVAAADTPPASWGCETPAAGAPREGTAAAVAAEGGDAEVPQGRRQQAQHGRPHLAPTFSSSAHSPAAPSSAQRHSRSFPVSPSPFGGLLPLEQPAANTPAAAPVRRAETHMHLHSGSDAGGLPFQQLGDAATVRPPRPPAAHAVGQEEEGEVEAEEQGRDVEVVCLSQAWSVFESLLRQVPASQPVIVLATCHAAAEGTPASLFQFFAGPSLASGAGQQHQEMNGHQHQHSHQQHNAQPCAALEAEPPSSAAAVAAPCIVRMQRPSEGAWRQAAASGADYVAAAAAAHAALLLRQGLSAAIVAASEQGQQAASDQPPAACSVQQQQQQQKQQPQQQQAAAAEGDALTAAPCLQPCNAAELQQGLRLFSQLLYFQRKLADMLDKDEERLDELASWTAQAAAGRRRGGGGGGQCPLTFTAIADQCRTGAYDSVDEVQAAAAAAAAVVLAAAQEVRQRARQEQRRRVRPLAPDECVELAPDAVTAACAVQDEIDCACHDLRQQLHLGEERNVDLLAAGAAHVRQLQRTETARRLAAAAEAAAADAAAADAAAVERAQQQAQQPGPQEEQAEEQQERDVQHPRQQQEAREPDVELGAKRAGAGAAAAAGAASQAQQQGQQQQLPAAAATALLQQKVIAAAAQLLRRHLWDLLRSAVHLHLPAAPPRHGSVWLALQESLGRLGRVAMAACGSVLGSLATMEGVEGLEAACDAGGEPASAGGLSGELSITKQLVQSGWPAAASSGLQHQEWLSSLAAQHTHDLRADPHDCTRGFAASARPALRRLRRAGARAAAGSRGSGGALQRLGESDGEVDAGPATDVQPQEGPADQLQVASVVGHPALVITRPVEWGTVLLGFEQANKYTVYDQEGNLVALLAEDEGSIGRAVGRQLLRTRRPFSATVLSPDGQVIFRMRRPFYLINSTMYIEDGAGNVVGEVQQRWHLWRRNYDLYIERRQFAAVQGGLLAWDFELKDDSGGTLALIDRNFSGFGKELFTDAGKYVIHFGSSPQEAAEQVATAVQAAHPDKPPPPVTALARARTDVSVIPTSTGNQLVVHRPLQLDERMVALAAAISIDYDFFSHHSHGGGVLGPFMIPPMIPYPVPSGGGGEEAAEGAAAGAEGAEGAGGVGDGSGGGDGGSFGSGGGAQGSEPLERDLGGDQDDWGGQDGGDEGGAGDGWGSDGGGGDDGGVQSTQSALLGWRDRNADMRGLSWLLGFVVTCQLACWAQTANMGSLDSTEPLRVGLLRDGNFPFSQPAQTSVPANHAGLEGFEIDLMDALFPLATLDERISGVANGTLDFTISALSYTPGREAVVHFIRPFYYESGVALFGSDQAGLDLFGPDAPTQQALEAASGWGGLFTGSFLAGQTLCADIPNLNVRVLPTLQEAADTVRGGGCAALMYDSITPVSEVGLQVLNATPAYESPYGVGISLEDKGSELEQRLVYAMTGLMNQGNSSRILALEQQWLVPNGIGPSSALQAVVTAISTFGSQPSGPGESQVPQWYSLFGTRQSGR